MKYNLQLSLLAQEQSDRAYVYYEIQRNGLGDRFIDRLEETLNLLGENPYLFALRHGSIRFALVEDFPYVVHYQVENWDVVVVGIVNSYQNPESWLNPS